VGVCGEAAGPALSRPRRSSRARQRGFAVTAIVLLGLLGWGLLALRGGDRDQALAGLRAAEQRAAASETALAQERAAAGDLAAITARLAQAQRDLAAAEPPPPRTN
jgi:hypothetical protein